MRHKTKRFESVFAGHEFDRPAPQLETTAVAYDGRCNAEQQRVVPCRLIEIGDTDLHAVELHGRLCCNEA